MASVKEYAIDFDDAVMARGRDYFRQRAVKIDGSDGSSVNARVLGNEWYRVRIDYDPDDPAYIVDYPDIPDIITGGSTLSEAFDRACEALDLYLEALDKLGRPLPEPRHRLVLESAGSA